MLTDNNLRAEIYSVFPKRTIPSGFKPDGRWHKIYHLLPGFAALDRDLAYTVFSNISSLQYRDVLSWRLPIDFTEVVFSNGSVLWVHEELRRIYSYGRDLQSAKAASSLAKTLALVNEWTQEENVTDIGVLKADAATPNIGNVETINAEIDKAFDKKLTSQEVGVRHWVSTNKMLSVGASLASASVDAWNAGTNAGNSELAKWIPKVSDWEAFYYGVLKTFRDYGHEYMFLAPGNEASFEAFHAQLDAKREEKYKNKHDIWADAPPYEDPKLQYLRDAFGPTDLLQRLKYDARWWKLYDLLPGFSLLDKASNVIVTTNVGDVSYKVASTSDGQSIGFHEVSLSDNSGTLLFSSDLQKVFVYSRSEASNEKLCSLAKVLRDAAGWPHYRKVVVEAVLAPDGGVPHNELADKISEQVKVARASDYDAIKGVYSRTYFIGDLRLYYQANAARHGALAKKFAALGKENFAKWEAESALGALRIVSQLDEIKKAGKEEIYSAKVRDVNYDALSLELRNSHYDILKSLPVFIRSDLSLPPSSVLHGEMLYGEAKNETNEADELSVVELFLRRALTQELNHGNGKATDILSLLTRAREELSTLRRLGVTSVGYATGRPIAEVVQEIHKVFASVSGFPVNHLAADAAEPEAKVILLPDQTRNFTTEPLQVEIKQGQEAERPSGHTDEVGRQSDLIDTIEVMPRGQLDDASEGRQPVLTGREQGGDERPEGDSVAPVEVLHNPKEKEEDLNVTPSGGVVSDRGELLREDIIRPLDSSRDVEAENPPPNEGAVVQSPVNDGAKTDSSSATDKPPHENQEPDDGSPLLQQETPIGPQVEPSVSRVSAARNGQRGIDEPETIRDSWKRTKKILKWTGRNAPSIIVGGVTGAAVRIGAQFTLAAFIATTPGSVAAIGAAMAAGALAGGTSRLVVTALFGDKTDPKWKRQAFLRGAVVGAVGAGAGAYCMHWLMVHGYLDRFIQHSGGAPAGAGTPEGGGRGSVTDKPEVSGQTGGQSSQSPNPQPPESPVQQPAHESVTLPAGDKGSVAPPPEAKPSSIADTPPTSKAVLPEKGGEGPNVHSENGQVKPEVPDGGAHGVITDSPEAGGQPDGHPSPSSDPQPTKPLPQQPAEGTAMPKGDRGSVPPLPDVKPVVPVETQPVPRGSLPENGNVIGDVVPQQMRPPLCGNDVMTSEELSRLPRSVRSLAASKNPKVFSLFCKEASFFLIDGPHHTRQSVAAGARLIKIGLGVCDTAGIHNSISRMLHADWAYMRAWGIGVDKDIPDAVAHARLSGRAVHNYGGRLLKLLKVNPLTNG